MKKIKKPIDIKNLFLAITVAVLTAYTCYLVLGLFSFVNSLFDTTDTVMRTIVITIILILGNSLFIVVIMVSMLGYVYYSNKDKKKVKDK